MLETLDKGGLMVGIFPDATYEEEEIQLEPGDLVVLYSDGVTEAEKSENEQYEEERLKACLAGAHGQAAADVLDLMVNSVHDFAGNYPQTDESRRWSSATGGRSPDRLRRDRGDQGRGAAPRLRGRRRGAHRTARRARGFHRRSWTPPRAWVERGEHGTLDWFERLREERSTRAACGPARARWSPSPGTTTVPTNPPAPLGIARYARGRDYHRAVASRLRELARFARAALPGAEVRVAVDTGPMLERPWAERAGIGFIGKHANLMRRDLGNWFLLGELVIDRELAPDPPAERRCGTCSAASTPARPARSPRPTASTRAAASAT